MVYADLHTHTIYSDGGTLAEQNVMWAKQLGMDAIAITDHDTTVAVYDAIRAGKEYGITVIPGVEVTTHDYHVLGYGIDLGHKGLQDLLKEARAGQRDEVLEKIAVLNEIGYDINAQDVLHQHPHNPEQRIGSVNLAHYLLMNNKIGELKNPSIWEVYGNIIKKQTDYISKSRVSPEEAVRTLKEAGGFVSFAHPPRDGHGVADLERMLNAGVDAFEVQPHYFGETGRKNSTFTYDVVIEFAKQNGIALTAGSDYHGPAYGQRPMLQKGQFDVEKFW